MYFNPGKIFDTIWCLPKKKLFGLKLFFLKVKGHDSSFHELTGRTYVWKGGPTAKVSLWQQMLKRCRLQRPTRALGKTEILGGLCPNCRAEEASEQASSHGLHEHGGSTQKDNRLSQSLLRRCFFSRWSFPEVAFLSLFQLPLPSLSGWCPQPLPGLSLSLSCDFSLLIKVRRGLFIFWRMFDYF